MLALTRRPGESITIGHNAEIRVMVTSRKGDCIRLAIEAPAEIPIHREEIYEKIQAEQKRRAY